MGCSRAAQIHLANHMRHAGQVVEAPEFNEGKTKLNSIKNSVKVKKTGHCTFEAINQSGTKSQSSCNSGKSKESAYIFCQQNHPLSLSPTLSHTHSFPLALSLSLSLSLSYTQTHTHTISLPLPFLYSISLRLTSHTPNLSFKHTHTQCLSFSFSHTNIYTLFLSLTLPLYILLSLTHSHSLSLPPHSFTI